MTEGVFSKIERAKSHLNEYENTVQSFFESARCVISIERDAETQDRLVKVKLVESAPTLLPVIIGEILYNLRSALDHTAIDLISESVISKRNLYFPIKPSKIEFDKWLLSKEANLFSDRVISRLIHLKPYKDGNDLLWAMHALRNYDSHNFLVPVGSVGRLGSLSHAVIVNAKVGLINSGWQRMDTGIIISNLGSSEDGTFNVHPSNLSISGTIRFGDVEIVQDKEVVEVIQDMIELTQNAIMDLYSAT